MVVPVWNYFKDKHFVKGSEQWKIKKHVEDLKKSFKSTVVSYFSRLDTYLRKPDSWVSYLGTKAHLLPFADNKVSRRRVAPG